MIVHISAVIEEMQQTTQSHTQQIEKYKTESNNLHTKVQELRDQLDIADATSKRLAGTCSC
jgi:cell division protein FtsB